MSDDANKRNLVYFENSSMRGLYSDIEEWQNSHNRRLLSLCVQQDKGNFCCIALTNPSEVVITSADGRAHVNVQMHGTYWTDDAGRQHAPTGYMDVRNV